jgi:transcriptional regulator with XRE-family HTH domain
MTGLHRTHVSLIERGLREPTLDTLVKLCRGLGVTPAQAILWHQPGARAARAAGVPPRSRRQSAIKGR